MPPPIASGLKNPESACAVLPAGPNAKEVIYVTQIGEFNKEHPDVRVTFVDGKAPPMLLIHGLSDSIVDPSNSVSLATHIRQKGGDVEFITYPKRGHGGVVIALAWPNQWLCPVLADVTDYFNRH